jgi:rfaE bifunctional protein kinase chain/domain
MAPPLSALGKLTRTFPRRRILVVGDLVADHYIFGQTDRVSREAPVLVVRYEHAEVKLGGGANAAANVRSLGGQVCVVGVAGRDPMGRALGQLCAQADIELLIAAAAHTETKTRIYAGGINTTRQQMLRLDRGGRGELPTRVRRALAQKVLLGARDADVVMVSDYGAGVVCEEVREVLRRLSADGMPVCADSRYHLRELGGLRLCKPNEPELEALTGVPIHTEGDLLRAGRRALELLACEALVVTRGRSGMAIFDRAQGAELLPVHGGADAVDVTGAGDTVLAALSLGIAAGGTVGQAARLANVAGGLVVQKQGTATVSRHELQAALEGA